MPQTPPPTSSAVDNALFSAKNVADFIREDVSDEQAAEAERVVWGWLKPVLRLAQRPEQLDDEQYSWAIELGAIAVKNPAGLAEKQVESDREKFDRQRQRDILALAASGGTQTSGPASAPSGRFGSRQRYPDPAEHYGRW